MIWDLSKLEAEAKINNFLLILWILASAVFYPVGECWILNYWIVQFKTFKIQASKLSFKPQALSGRPLANFFPNTSKINCLLCIVMFMLL